MSNSLYTGLPVKNISITEGAKNELIVFQSEIDKQAFLELLRLNSQTNNRSMAVLHQLGNAGQLTNHFRYYEGKIFLCLSGDHSGRSATQEILNELKDKNIKDIRPLYGIGKEHLSLNDYLKKKIENQNENQTKNFNLVQAKNNSNEQRNNTEPQRLSDTEQVEPEKAARNLGATEQKSKSEQDRNYIGRSALVSQDVGNGLTGGNEQRLGNGGRGRSDNGTQPKNDAEDAGREHSVGGILSRGTLPDRGLNTSPSEPSEIEALEKRIARYKGQKVSNEQISEIVNLVTTVGDGQKIHLKHHLASHEYLKDICSRYKSGGTAKEGRGILDEYYTDAKIVDAVRNLIKNRVHAQNEIFVLEPSVGTGNFLYAAKDLGIKANITAFEINETTAKIAKILHPEANIHLRSFETEFIDDRGQKKDFSQKYDLIIGNPPYGDHRGYYKGLGEEPKLAKYEDYFVKRSLDVLKQDGILAMVLPSGWLNRQTQLKGSEMVNAFRLPSGAFKGTQVGTDIIILKKNTHKISEDISGYFEKHPEHILGEIREKTNRFGRPEQYVHGSLEEALQKIVHLQNKKETVRIGNLFEDFFNQDPFPKQNTESNEAIINLEEKSGASIEEKALNQAKENIKNALSKLGEVKFKSPAVESEISKYQQLLKDITEIPEKFDAESLSEINEKADKIIKKQSERNTEYRVQTQPEIKKGILKYHFKKPDAIVETALQNSPDLSQEQIAAFRDTEYDGTLNNHGKHYQFANYHDGKWMHDFYYAEGNIYSKLEQLEKDFADKFSVGGMENQYEKQKALLESVLPKPKNLDQIFMSPNHEFVHNFIIGEKEREQWNADSQKMEIIKEPKSLADEFKSFVGKLSNDAFAGSSYWEVWSFVDNENVTGSDKERNALIRERRKAAANDLFQKFLREELSEDLRERYVKEFNRNYNNIYVPDYAKFPLFSKIYQNFKGKPLTLTEVQKAGIGRQTTKGVGLLAHEVGFGKTLSGILSMHEAMERGNAKRPLIVVPNESILKQWIETIFETIPDAKVNVLGNLGKDYDLSKFDNKDGEISIVTYEGFNNIGFKEEITRRLASTFSYISESELKSVNSISERDFQKQIEKEKELVGKMKRGKIYDWEDFGFDHLTYDEVHNANHIVGKVRIEDRRFASDFRSQNQQTSKLGINTWMAAQYIQEQNDGRNVTLLSATPFTNKPLEYYSILSLIANKRLEESGYFNVNTFFETFMEADNDMEIDAKGDVKFKANVRRFKNNSLFQQLLSEFIDIKGEEDNPELKRPNKINKEYKIEQNDLTKEQYDMLNDNFSETQKGAILTHILNARLIAISPYLSPYYEDEEPSLEEFIENSPKLKQTMDLIRQNKKDLPNSGQIIYSELAVSEFPKLKEYLVQEVGYQPEEIGIITGATTKSNRLKIQENFNEGKIKVVIGSEAIQEGMNLQKNTTDVYMLSLPYNFTSLRQVEGRAWRQGNQNENVRINFMLTNDSIDVFMLQKLQSKQARYLEAMKKGADVLDISDISTQELKTAIITSPETRANIEIELLKKRIENQKSRYVADNAFILRKHQDFLKIQEGVTKAQNDYNRILGYSNDGSANSDYWKNQLSFYQKNIDAAKQLVDEKISELAGKGVNVEEIEKQTKSTDEKIEALEKELEKLPEVKAKLVSKYTEEKQKQLLENQKLDYVKERADENAKLFGAVPSFEEEKLEIAEIELAEEVENKVSFSRRR